MLFLYFELGLNFSVYIFSECFFVFFIYIYILVYMKISFEHRKAICFLVKGSCREMKIKASFDTICNK